MDDIGGQWNRFNKSKDKHKTPKCGVKPIFVASAKALLLCVVSVGVLYRERVLSTLSAFKEDAISGFDLDATMYTYSTVSCNIDNKNELQCLVHMHPEISETRNCYTSHGTVNHSFCGRLCK